MKLPKTKICKDEPAETELTVMNSGKIAGEEKVKMYLTHTKRKDVPLYSLRGFEPIGASYILCEMINS